jgi:hypothetical protein
MMNKITKNEYQEFFNGYAIKSIAIKNNNACALTLYEDIDLENESLPRWKRFSREGELNYRFIFFRFEESKNRLGWAEIEGGEINRALMTYPNEQEPLSVDFNGWTWEGKVEGLENWPSYQIPQTDSVEPAQQNQQKGPMLNVPGAEYAFPKGRLRYISELKVIDDVVYACGGVRKVLRRESYEKWTDLTLMKEHPQLQKEYLEAKESAEKPPIVGSFKSMDGFDANDLYACGVGGDFWHFDGKTWGKISMPLVDLYQVVCGQDGNVYIAARDGKVFKGRAAHGNENEHWKLIESNTKGLLGNPFEGATWFKGKLYLSTSYGLYALDNDEIIPVDFGKEVQHSFQHVTANDEILISYGPYNALVFDGKKWNTIISSLVN